jgi:ATPase subunit of ABC transporter with duplicated ATPase domains
MEGGGVDFFGWYGILFVNLLTGVLNRANKLKLLSCRPVVTCSRSNFMLRVQSLSFSYSDLLFHNVSFHVSKGELLAIIGLNGCGKSTLLACLMGEKKPSSGSIFSDFSRGFGALPQESPVFHCTTWDFIMAGSQPLYSLHQNMHSHPENPAYIWQYEEKGGFLWEQRLYKELSIFGFEDSILQRDYQVLSGGEKKFLQLIQLFLSDKSCYFLDEPTNDLDIHKRKRLASILQSKKKEGKAFVIISHDRDLLNHCADAIYHMRFGSGAMYTGSYDDFHKRLMKNRNGKNKPQKS